MSSSLRGYLALLLSWMPLWLLVGVWSAFAMLSPQFRTAENTLNILLYSASAGVVAVGMTFVLLTAGIDLSVGAIMLVGGAIAGKLLLGGFSVPIAAAAMLSVGVLWGLVNGVCITRLKMTPFIVTIATFFIGRGLGLWVTQTKAMNLPNELRELATSRYFGLPTPVWILLCVVIAAELVLMKTPLGRQIYAIGADATAAWKAGIAVRLNTTIAYVMCAVLAALGGLITLAQLSAVSPTLGEGRELNAIAAAVLGGVSLFGGRGRPMAAALGAILIQTLFNGLTTVDADPNIHVTVDPYLYPLITASIIFLAVLLDSTRQRFVLYKRRRLKLAK